MSTPDISRSRSVTPTGKGRVLFRTASGKLVAPEVGRQIELNDVPRQVDVCIVFDTTGSMNDKIDGLVSCMVDFIGEMSILKLDWRFTVVPFGDLTVPGDRVVGDLPFTAQRQAAEEMIRKMPRFSGGGNSGESSLEALQAAMAKQYRAKTVRVVLLLTDEPPLVSRNVSTVSVGRALAQQEFVCFVASPAGHGFERLATENAGRWYPIGSRMNTTDLLTFLKGLLKDVARVSKAVHEVGGGSVRKYIDEVKRLELGR